MEAAQPAGEEAQPGARAVKVVLVGDGGCGKTSLLMVFAEGAFPEVSACARPRQTRCAALAREPEPGAMREQTRPESPELTGRRPCLSDGRRLQGAVGGYGSSLDTGSAPSPPLLMAPLLPQSYTPTVFERLSVNLQMKGKPVYLQIWDTAGQVDYDRLRPLFYPDASVLLLCFDVTSPHSFDNIPARWYPEVSHFCKGVPVVLVGCKTDLRKDKVLVKKLRKSRLEPVTYHRGQEMARSVGAVAYLECSALLQENVQAVFQEAAKVALSSRSRNIWRRITRIFCVVT
ncbi:Rho-related GTP-binding protein RhoD [Galemys pyrenaicus]|uniref:Rho-related GTP-binding protein RhoD n=1 Tax=Galemys pyrenaicus TaxID=202257 RepID=A0A8J6DYJ2_GALPY|nr:Rho-related GTP-binding protein RhoD [Galemys pyrenaicus]